MKKIKLKGEYAKLATELRKIMHKEFYWAAYYSGYDDDEIKKMLTLGEVFLIRLYYKYEFEYTMVCDKDTDEQHKILQEYKDSK